MIRDNISSELYWLFAPRARCQVSATGAFCGCAAVLIAPCQVWGSTATDFMA